MENLVQLIKELVERPSEENWFEFKHNNYDPKMIGKDISALSNGAALSEKEYAYFVWGIDDETHGVVGTDYNLQNLKVGNEEIENWLRHQLSPHADFEYNMVEFKGVTVGVMRIEAALSLPVSFEKQEYIRVGSYTKSLKDYPQLQARLWAKLQNKKFEVKMAKEDLTLDEAFTLLRYEQYFDALGMERPSSIEGMINFFVEDEIILQHDNGLYGITNFGAILLARRLKQFPNVVRKAPRVVQYKDNTKVEILKEKEFESGYAVAFEDIIQYIEALLPSQEIIEGGIRKKVDSYPEIAIRECVANALIHQDFSIKGAGPTIEIYPERIEITNPGAPLVDVFRIIDTPPKSRNEKLSALMRRMGMCEELGTGWDKIAIECEKMLMPAPRIEVYEENTRVMLYARGKFASLTIEDRLWACYLHACVQFLKRDFLTNSSLRKRFGLNDSSSAMVSRIIKEAVEKKIIRAFDPDTAPRYMKYVPIWG